MNYNISQRTITVMYDEDCLIYEFMCSFAGEVMIQMNHDVVYNAYIYIYIYLHKDSNDIIPSPYILNTCSKAWFSRAFTRIWNHSRGSVYNIWLRLPSSKFT